MSGDPTEALRARSVALLLEPSGWELRAAEIDLARQTARIELRRDDGLLVTLDARDGHASVTRERTEHATERVGREGFAAEVLRHRFIGRERFPLGGARSALRWLADYIDDNALRPMLSGRPAMRLLLNEAANGL